MTSLPASTLRIHIRGENRHEPVEPHVRGTMATLGAAEHGLAGPIEGREPETLS